MPASEVTPMGSQEEIAGSLRRRAVDLWGPERGELLGPVIEQVASNLFRLSQDAAPSDEEPGFYFEG